MAKRSIYEQVGRRVANIRNQQGMTQEALAAAADCGTSYIARIESGKRKPTLEVLARIAAGLRVPLAELIDPSVRSTARPRRLISELVAAAQPLGPTDLKLITRLAVRLARARTDSK